MSNLIKALKRAEADRQAALSAQPIAPQARTVESVRKVEGPDPVAALPASGRYAGVWVMVALAATLAVAFGYWTRQPVATISVAQAPLKVSSPAPGTLAVPAIIPSALGMNEVGPMQLQLDRRVDALGNVGLRVPPRQ